MEALISAILGNLVPILFVLSFAVAAFAGKPARYEARLLDWLLLLFLGIGSTWSGIFHVFFPGIASASIGWAPSPFETEIGIADIAMGVMAFVAFWRTLDFKAAVIVYVVIFHLGVTIVHVHDAMVGGNVAANNFGLLLISTIMSAFLLPWLYFRVRRSA